MTALRRERPSFGSGSVPAGRASVVTEILSRTGPAPGSAVGARSRVRIGELRVTVQTPSRSTPADGGRARRDPAPGPPPPPGPARRAETSAYDDPWDSFDLSYE